MALNEMGKSPSRPPRATRRALAGKQFRRPGLALWSINEAELTELTGGSRADYERELRISALGVLLCSSAATLLWRRVCKAEMYREIRARSQDRHIAMELAIQESMR